MTITPVFKSHVSLKQIYQLNKPRVYTLGTLEKRSLVLHSHSLVIDRMGTGSRGWWVSTVLVTFLAAVTNSWQNQLAEGKVCFGLQYGPLWFRRLGSKSRRQQVTWCHSREMGRVKSYCTPHSSLFHLFHLVQDPSPCDGATHIQGGFSSSDKALGNSLTFTPEMCIPSNSNSNKVEWKLSITKIFNMMFY